MNPNTSSTFDQGPTDPVFERKRFEALVRALGGVTWRTTADGRFLDLQPGWAAFTGQTFDQYKEHRGFDAIHPDDRVRVWEIWAAAVRDCCGFQCEMRVWHAGSGTFHWCSSSAEPVRDESGEIIEWIGTMVDIDSRKRDELALEERERRFRSIFERVQAIGVMIDSAGRVTFANDYLLNLTGWSRDEVVGADYFDTFIRGTSDIREKFYDAIATGDIFAHAENEILTRTGERRVISWDNTILRSAEGAVIGTASIGHDITDERQWQYTVEQSERRFRTLVEAMPQLVWSARADGWCEYLSSQWVEFTGMPESACHGLGWQNCIHPDDRAHTAECWQQFIAGRAPYDTEYRLRRHDGQYRWFKARAAVLRAEDGSILYVYGTSTDIEDQKVTEQALRNAQEALVRSEKLAAAGSLAATLAHEINNPLEAVLNLIFLARLPQTTEEERATLLASAEREITRASELATRSLRFYRKSDAPQTESIQRVIETVLFVYGPKMQQHGVSLTTDYEEIAGVSMPESDLRQVLYNLVSNAIDAMPSGGALRLRLSTHGTNARRLARITVADTGTGIAPQNRERVFRPFFTTKADVGTGLGLWVSRDIAERHGGTIRYRSGFNSGYRTIFSVTLPIAEVGAGMAGANAA